MKRYLATALLLSSLGASAQSAESLPERLVGRWVFTVSNGKTFTDRFAIVFEGARAPGTVSARITHHGLTCGADAEPVTTNWDGTTLRFDVTLKANVNAQRMNACNAPRTTYQLQRTASGTFEGTIVNETGATATATASP